MGYVDSLLGRGEQIMYVARQHVFVLVSRVLAELGLIAVLVAAGVASNAAFRNETGPVVGSLRASELILLICIGISILVLVSGFVDYLRWNTEQFIVTDRRVIQVRGVLNKAVIDSSLDKINDVVLRQSLLGRLFNFGTIEILTASEEGINIMDRIGSPLDFKQAMQEAKRNHERGYGYLEPRNYAPTGPAVSPRADIQRTLEELAALRDRGILSTDEFEAKKRELLNRI